MKVALYFKVILALVVVCFVPGYATADLRSNVRSWLDAFDLVPATNPRVERVQSIFQKIKRVTRGADLRVKLFIVDSDNEPWAVALQDGNIILSRGAIDVIYDGTDLAASDARMAFVLGHELAHIVANDFWHQQVYASFLANDGSSTQSGAQQQRRKEQELRADDEGFIYASLAGFSTREIFSSVGTEKTFLHHWAEQTKAIPDGDYHTTEERDKFLHSRLAELEKAVEFFKYGVRLAHFGRYEDARILLEKFYRAYPSRQVLSNLGYVYLQIARDKMPTELGYRFWYPTLLEYDAGLPTPSRTLSNSLPKAAEVDLRTAVELLEAGTALDVTDLTGRINLIAAYLYLGDSGAAQAILKEAIKGRESNAQLLALRALVVMENQERDGWNTEAREKLELLATRVGADDNIVYNYARLLEERGRHGKAKGLWRRLSNSMSTLPVSYQYMICRHIETDPACSKNPEYYGFQGYSFEPEIEPGEDVDAPQTRQKLKKWGVPVASQIDHIDALIYRHPNGDSLLAIDNIVELVSLKQHGFSFKQQLRERKGSPLVQIPLGSDYLWSYGAEWSALVRGEEVEEIWLAQ